ncbi:hypothetical protein CHCC15543_0475 [Bacillus licheniformis]|nr:hypothetical protein CHCC15543_0475 [Bacillus licheniformis]
MRVDDFPGLKLKIFGRRLGIFGEQHSPLSFSLREPPEKFKPHFVRLTDDRLQDHLFPRIQKIGQLHPVLFRYDSFPLKSLVDKRLFVFSEMLVNIAHCLSFLCKEAWLQPSPILGPQRLKAHS